MPPGWNALVVLGAAVEPDGGPGPALGRRARHAARIAREHGLRRLGVVTDAYHMPRALMAFRAFGVDALACPVPAAEAARDPWRTRWARLREVPARAWYRVRIAALARARDR